MYAIRVSEVLGFNSYFMDSRFQYKKPHPAGDWQARCGDNIYHLENGEWKQEWSPFHKGKQFRQDTKHPRVFVAEEFFYFGENAVSIPLQFSDIIRRSQGCRCSYPSELVNLFVKWLQKEHRPGMRGLPRDRKQLGNEELIPLKAKPG